MKKKSKTGEPFRTRFDTITLRGYLLVDFFDDCDYLGTVKFWDNGEVSLKRNEDEKEVVFKSPRVFMNTVCKAKGKTQE